MLPGRSEAGSVFQNRTGRKMKSFFALLIALMIALSGCGPFGQGGRDLGKENNDLKARVRSLEKANASLKKELEAGNKL